MIKGMNRAVLITIFLSLILLVGCSKKEDNMFAIDCTNIEGYKYLKDREILVFHEIKKEVVHLSTPQDYYPSAFYEDKQTIISWQSFGASFILDKNTLRLMYKFFSSFGSQEREYQCELIPVPQKYLDYLDGRKI
jgi:hypothetical protein